MAFVPALQTYSVLAASFAAGANLSTSLITFPALLAAPNPSVLTKQWSVLYNTGILPVVSTALSSSAGFAYLAYHFHSRTTTHAQQLLVGGAAQGLAKRNFYAGAALLMVGLGPYTALLMGGTIKELERRAGVLRERDQKGGNGEEEEEQKAGLKSRALVEQWGAYNLWRGVMLLTGTGMGIWASIV